MAGTIIEQVPRYSLSYTDDGSQERLQLVVQLPGLASAKDFQVTVKPDLFTLHAEGRYRLSLPLNPPVNEKPELLRYVKKKAVLKAELKVLPDSLLRATPSPAAGQIRPRSAHASRQLSPDISSSPDRGFNATDQSNTHTGTAGSADVSAHAHAQPSSFQGNAAADASPDQAAVARAEALREMMEQLIAQQWTTGQAPDAALPDHESDRRSSSSSHGLSETEHTDGHVSEHPDSDTQSASSIHHHFAEPSRGAVNGTRSTGSTPGLYAGPQQNSPVTPSLSNPGNVYSSSSSIHAASGFATETLNPLWSPDSDATSISHPTTPQANANESSGWETDTAEHSDSEAGTGSYGLSPGSGWGGFDSSPQSAVHAASPTSDTQSAAHPATTSNDVQSRHMSAGASNDTQSDPQPASTSNDTAEAATADIYQAAQTRLNKDAAEAFFVKGEEAVKVHDWPKAGRLLTKACSLDQQITERLAGMLSKLDKRFVPRLKEHMSADLLKAYPGGTKPAAATSTTPKSHSQTQEDINADAAAAAAAESPQASASEATSSADATAAAAAATSAAATSAAASPQTCTPDTTSGAKASSGEKPLPGCHDGGSLPHETQQQHQPDPGVADSRKRRFSHISEGDFCKGYRGSQQTSPPDPTVQPEASTSHAKTPDSSADNHPGRGPAADGQARPNSQSQSQHGVTHPQTDEEPAVGIDVQSSMLDLWVSLSVFVMSSYNLGVMWYRTTVAGCKTGAAYSCNLLLSCCKTAAAYGKIGIVYLWGLALDGMRVAMGPILQLCCSVLRPSVPILIPAAKGLTYAVVIALTLCLFALQYLSNYVLLLLWLTGKHKWGRSLVMGHKRGEWKARLVMWVGSPLLAMATLWCLQAISLNLGLLSVFKWCVKWPLQTCWQLICTFWGCVTSGWFVVPAGLLSWTLASSPGTKTHCIDGVLFWALGCKWMGVAAVLLRMCASGDGSRIHDTWATHAAIWAECEIWTSEMPGFGLFRFVTMVAIWYAWAYREQVLIYLLTLVKDASDAPASKPQAPSTGKAESVPQSPNLNTPKQEVVRILSAKSHYTVLEVDSKATEDAIKKARRMKSLLVHPDKVGPDVQGANEAFGKVTLAAEVLSNPAQRREYDAELRASTPYAAQPGQASSQQHADEEDAANVHHQACHCCGGVHKFTRKPDMDPTKCRWCKVHNTFHPLKKGEGWVHLKQAGFFGFIPEYVVYACLDPDGAVYEITESAMCQGILDSETFQGADCCKVWFTFGPQTTHKDRQKQQQQDQRQERYTGHQQQQQSTSQNAGGRKKGRKGRKRR